jgi:hypothetical protein
VILMLVLGISVSATAGVYLGVHRGVDPMILAAAGAVGWCLLLLGRGMAVPLLATLFVPATVTAPVVHHMSSLVYLVALGGAVLAFVVRGVARLGSSQWVVLFLVLTVALAFGDGSSKHDLLISLRPLATLAALAWLLAKTAREAPDTYRRVVTVAVWCGAAEGVLAVYQVATGTWGWFDKNATSVEYTSFSYAGRAAGTMGHPIVLGAVLSALAVCALTIRPMRFAGRLATFNIVGVALSGSRSSYIALALAVLVMVSARRANRAIKPHQVVGAGILGSLGVLAAGLVSSAAAAAISSLGSRLHIAGDRSLSERTSRISIAWQQIQDTPRTFLFGHGALADQQYITGFGIGDTTALTFDNYYLVVWYDYGLLGVVALVGALLLGFRAGGKLARPLIATAAAEFYFFDASGWPAMLAVVALAFSAVTYDRVVRVSTAAADQARPATRDLATKA